MPTVARWRGYRFSFYSREPDAPPHVHVVQGNGQAKSCIMSCSLAKSVGFADHELTQIAQKVRRDRAVLLLSLHWRGRVDPIALNDLLRLLRLSSAEESSSGSPCQKALSRAHRRHAAMHCVPLFEASELFA